MLSAGVFGSPKLLLPIVSGVYADGSAQAGRVARMAQDAGAKAPLVFSSAVFGTSGMSRPEMIMAHFKAVADNADLPLIIFQYAANTPLCYPTSIIEELADTFPQIVALKDASYDAQTHEYLTRTLQARARPVTMFTSHSGWSLGSLAMGAKTFSRDRAALSPNSMSSCSKRSNGATSKRRGK